MYSFYKVNKNEDNSLDININDDIPVYVKSFDTYAYVIFSECTPKSSWELINDYEDLLKEFESISNNSYEKTDETSVSNEEIQAEILLNQTEIINKQNEHDEILAEILLGQQEVK